MDIPLFGDEPGKRRRQINLGGASTATTQASILQDARIRRQRRQEEKRRQDSAIRIQNRWRAVKQSREVRQYLRTTFAQDVTSLTGLRCLVLLKQDNEALTRWTYATLQLGSDRLFQALAHPNWCVLLRQVSLQLLRSISNDIKSPSCILYLQVLDIILLQSPSTSSNNFHETRINIFQYLILRGYYQYLSTAISKFEASLPSPSSVLQILVNLLTAPFATLSVNSNAFKQSLEQLLVKCLSIPLLPNRLLSSNSLATFSSRLPLSHLDKLDPSSVLRDLPILENRIHLLANLGTFIPVSRITPSTSLSLPPQAINVYVRLLAVLISSLPADALEPLHSNGDEQADAKVRNADSDSDSEVERSIRVEVVESFQSKAKISRLDGRTLTRLQNLRSPAYINAILAAMQRNQADQPSFFAWGIALCNVWPNRKGQILGLFVVYGGGGLVRELYRGYVRNSSIGQDNNPSSLSDPAQVLGWPPFLFLVELYTQALLTMGDDEFFGSASGGARNPLTLDELIVFSKKLMNVAFTLYWKEGHTDVQSSGPPGISGMTWEILREKVTKCLQAIHTRDSRKPFTSPDHWLVTSQLEMAPFIQAAIVEERQITQPGSTRLLTKRQMASMSPRLGILNNIPFAIPFEIRVSIFRSFIVNDMNNTGYNRYNRSSIERVVIRRRNISQDGFDKLQKIDLKAPIAITFIDQFDQEEAGIDGGGVFKEFLTSLCKEVFDSDRGLWLATQNNELYPNPHSYATESHSLDWYRFVGRILGKALYEGILVDIAFAGFFLAKWLKKQSFLDDLVSLDPELYKGLIILKNYERDPEELSLNFTVNEQEFGVTKTIPLIADGANITVTKENRLRYIYLVSNYRLNKQIKHQSNAFFEGLSEMIDPNWLRMFNQQELQILLGGVNSPIDLDDLRTHAKYGGLYDDHEPTIQMFWRVVKSFDQEHLRKLLRFVTSCSRPPLLGFKELVPNFAIRDSGSDESRLPTASTCVNLLKLPRYTNERILREKLIQAINSNAGFDLS